MPSSERISTCVPGLDDILKGGFLRASSYLLVGRAGTGKTLTSLQWLLGGRDSGERCLYIGLSEPVDSVIRNAGFLGWNVDHIDFLDLYPSKADDTVLSEQYTVFPPSDVERSTIWDSLLRKIQDARPERLVVDSVTQLRYLSPDDYQFRKQIGSLIALLYHMRCTSLLTFEDSEHEREASVALAVDGVIRLTRGVSKRRVIGLRSLEVEKLRGSDFMTGYHSMRISGNGVRVFPHRIEDPGNAEMSGKRLAFGIEGLDAQLVGGLERGTTTILSGQSGVGKSTLSLHFAVHGVLAGERAIVYAFEESVGAISARSKVMGLDIEPMLEDGRLVIKRINPIELYPDEFLTMLRTDVEDDNRTIVVLDSLRGYDLAMAEFATPVANIQNMTSYLKRMQVTAVLINEIEGLSGSFLPTELGVSYVADNILLLRYAETENAISRVISCLKKRHGNFERTLRTFDTLPGEGIVVGEELRGYSGLLHSVPSGSRPL
jgi:circadian clock protein KaiC